MSGILVVGMLQNIFNVVIRSVGYLIAQNPILRSCKESRSVSHHSALYCGDSHSATLHIKLQFCINTYTPKYVTLRRIKNSATLRRSPFCQYFAEHHIVTLLRTPLCPHCAEGHSTTLRRSPFYSHCAEAHSVTLRRIPIYPHFAEAHSAHIA